MPKPPKVPNTNPFELPEDRLASTTATGKRVYIHPASVSGVFKRWRNKIHTVFILIFLMLPWTKVAGHQTVLLDIANRKFSLFGVTFWAHDAPMLVLVFLTFVLTMGLVTALFGRVWCGWACPQTVFIESVYRRVEEWIEGTPHQRSRLDSAPLSVSKVVKRVVKWGLFIGISLVITHSFLAYFVGSSNLIGMISQSPSQHPGPFIMIVISTAIIAFDFGWFREQFCIIACPYGRMQSVLMDDHSLVVAYDATRGEPRKQDRHDTASTGDCINCYRCVQVCPTGVDIRRGVQLECIMCTACIDACDSVMDKINKPKGLIRYESEVGLSGKKTRWIRPRVIVYSVLLAVVVSVMVWILSTRQDIQVTVTRPKEIPFQVLEDGELLNHFKLIVRNQSFHSVTAQFSIDPSSPFAQLAELVVPMNSVKVASGKSYFQDVFIRLPLTHYQPNLYIPIHITLTDDTGKVMFDGESVELIGPSK